jgi:16S rRNA (cytidine1402-2'-O)-methyltransferase
MKKKGILYLFPTFLDPSNTLSHIAPRLIDIAIPVDHYIGETEKNVRAFIKKITPSKDQTILKIELLNEHTASGNVKSLLRPLMEGHDVILMSDAGMPCIADPGSEVVRLCHEQQIQVVPLEGASSILMTLIASGFTGQQFTFHGYLPYDKEQRKKKIKQMETDALSKNYTQVFMEAPYRNKQLLKELTETCDPKTMLCAGIALTSPEEKIITQPISAWKKAMPDLHKIAVMFVMGR